MSKEKKGIFAVAVSSKGGVGKSTISNQVLTALLYEKEKKKVKLIEVDDNNITNTYTSSLFHSQSFKVEKGIEETLRAMFDVLSDESVVIDAGGGNDSNALVDSLLSMGIDEHVVYFIPVLKNKSGMKNLIDMYRRIRAKSTSKIVVILNQTKSTQNDLIKSEFLYFFGDKEMGIKGVFEEVYKDDNLIVTSLQDTSVYDLSEGLGLTAYEIANDAIKTDEFLKEEQKKGYDAFMKALAFVKIYNLCAENHKNSFLQFMEDVAL